MNSKRARPRSVVLVNNKDFICTNIKQSRLWKEFVWNQQNCDWSKSWVLIQKKEVLMCGTKQETMLALTSSLNSFNYDRKLQQKGGLSLQVGLSQRGTMLTDTNNTIYVRKHVRNYGSGLSTMMLVINWWTLTCKEAKLRENGKSDFLWVGSATHCEKKSRETDTRAQGSGPFIRTRIAHSFATILTIRIVLSLYCALLRSFARSWNQGKEA